MEISKEVLAREFKKKTRDEWEEIFKDKDACVSPVLDLDEAPLNKHNIERKSFIKLDDNKMLPSMNWLNMSSDNGNRNFRMPNVGEHTKLILSELGYTQNQIKQLIERNAVEQCEQTKSNL
jgi:alpha-methylacyl-CoA racemase